jgi:hypothetical protein
VCNLYSITTKQEAIRALFRVINRYVGNLAPMPGVFPDYLAPGASNSFGLPMLSYSRATNITCAAGPLAGTYE